MPKATCARINQLQDTLVAEAISLYDKKKYPKFWEAIYQLESFMSVKESLGCKRKKR